MLLGNAIAGFHGVGGVLGGISLHVIKRIVMVGSRWC